MKALIFANTVPSRYGAYEILLEEIHLAAREQGDSVIPVLGGPPCKAVADKWQQAGMTWDVLDGWTSTEAKESPWLFAAVAPGLINRYRPDVVAVHFGNELPAIAAKLRSSRSVKWVWEQDQQIKDPTVLSSCISKIRLVGILFDRVVAMYEGGMASLKARRVKEDKIAVIHNSIRDHMGDVSDIRDELGIFRESTVLFSTCTLIPRKRVGLLIRTLTKVSNECSLDVHLVVAGGGPERNVLAEMARERGVEDRVHLVGERNDVRSLLPCVDIYVHSSIAETCTYAVTEAMCAGKPVVMTAAGAAKEQIVNGVNGYVLGKNDMDGFVARLKELIENRETRQRLGKNGRQRWSRMFRVEDAATRYVDLYRSLVRDR